MPPIEGQGDRLKVKVTKSKDTVMANVMLCFAVLLFSVGTQQISWKEFGNYYKSLHAKLFSSFWWIPWTPITDYLCKFLPTLSFKMCIVDVVSVELYSQEKQWKVVRCCAMVTPSWHSSELLSTTLSSFVGTDFAGRPAIVFTVIITMQDLEYSFSEFTTHAL